MLEFYILATFEVISGQVLAHDTHGDDFMHYSAVVLGDRAAGTMVRYLIQSHYPDTELTGPFHILVMLGTRLLSDKYQYCKSLI